MSIYKNSLFYLLILYGFLIVNGHTAPLYYLPSRAQLDLGLSAQKAAMLVLVSGIVNLPGRPLLGFLGSHSLQTRYFIYLSIVFITGLMTCMLALFTTDQLLLLYAVSAGVLGSEYIILSHNNTISLSSPDKYITISHSAVLK